MRHIISHHMTIQHITSHTIWSDFWIESLIERCLVLSLLHDVTSFLLFLYLLFFLSCSNHPLHLSSFTSYLPSFLYSFLVFLLSVLPFFSHSSQLKFTTTITRNLDEFRETGLDSWTVFENERMPRLSNRSSSSGSHQSCQWRIWYVRVNICTYTKRL